MSGDNLGFVSWEECIICHERGKRVVHFYLKDKSGNSILAVIGTERSIRHMTYFVANDFVRMCGSETLLSPMCTKWRSRREVVEWLTSLVPEHFVPSDYLNVTGISHKELMGYNAKKNKSWKKRPRFEASGMMNSTVTSQTTKHQPTYPKLRFKLSWGPAGIKFTEPKLQCPLSFEIDEKIELLCQDSGIRGCWFRCKIVQTSQKFVKVEYDDVEDAEEAINLQEWIPVSRVALPDKLGMRYSGRQTIRPRPQESSVCSSLKVGTAVDAWWNNGWWEGVITEADISGNDSLQVYFPGENIFKTLKKEDMRASRDWVDNAWREINPKPDILNCISATANAFMKPTLRCTIVDGSTMSDSNVVKASKREEIEEDKQQMQYSQI